MGRRKKSDIPEGNTPEEALYTAIFGQKPKEQKKLDRIEEMNKEARQSHLTYGQLQAQKLSSQIEFSNRYVINDGLKTVRERMQEKAAIEEAERLASENTAKRGRPKKQ